MKDETYVFISDVKNKGSVARSARHRKTHAGKGGRVRLPSDNLSKKELMKMSGECKSYRLNEPMVWKEFRAMPDDIKVTYINLLRKKYGVPDAEIAAMLGIHKVNFSKEVSQIKARNGDSFQKRTGKFDKDGFYAWWHGVENLATPVLEEEPAEEPIREEPEPIIITEEPEAFVEEELPWNEPDFVPTVDFKPYTATPCNGSMSFKNCPADQALNTLKQLLGDANVTISIMWKTEEGDAGDGNV